MMKLIVGLGNPGEKYKNTRHNVGFMAVEKIAENNNGMWEFEKKFNSEICRFGDTLLAKPHTFMNNSGEAVSKIVNYFDVDLNDLIIVHDEVDLEEGETRFKKGSGDAGHHGVIDIINKLGTQDFWRFRIGVGRPKSNKFEVNDYVLSVFKPDLTTITKNLEQAIGL